MVLLIVTLNQMLVCKKKIIGYVFHVPTLTTTNPMFKKAGVLKPNDVYKLQIYNLMHITIQGLM